MNELLELLKTSSTPLPVVRISERLCIPLMETRRLIKSAVASKQIFNTREFNRATYTLVKEQNPDLIVKSSARNLFQAGTYDGKELSKNPDRPGINDAQLIPSRINNKRYYRDGRVEDVKD